MFLYYLKIPVIYGVMLFFSSIISLFWSFELYFTEKVVFLEWSVMNMSSVDIIMTFLMDWMSLSFMATVLLISSMVMLYSYIYMLGDSSVTRFIILVFLFVLSMVFLILSPNLISILLGWDGLGLVSYCLVIYYQNMKSASAGMLTVLSNRIGDVAILLSISWMFNYGGWNFFYLPYMFMDNEVLIILMLVLLAAMTKSAQIPFSAWLPAAMAAPTPVSSLVHSSTLVTAGVYLLLRFNELLGVNFFLFYLSIITMFMSGLGANFEMDLKKIIALSTLSQLGVMMMTLSLGLVELAYFHLISHALFKSLLFLCAGVYIHSYNDIQDIRYLGGTGKILPVTSVFFIGCSFSLCGFPFLSGFYSKDLILESYFMQEMNLFLFTMIMAGTMFTISYSVRLIYYLFVKNLGLEKYVMAQESKQLYYPMLVLFMSSIFSGSFFNWLYLPPLVIILPFFMKTMVLMVGMLVVYLVMMIKNYMYFEAYFSMSSLKMLVHYIGGMWFLPYLSTYPFVSLLKMGGSLIKHLDQGWLEESGGQGLFKKISIGSVMTDNWNIVNIKSYLTLFFIFMMILFMII